MNLRQLLAISAAMAALAAAEAGAQQRAVSGPRITIPSHSNHFSWERGHGFKRGFPGVWIVERETVREVVRETPPPPAAVPSGRVEPSGGRSASGHSEQAQGGAKARKPYVIGSTYASLPPQGCMKLVELAASYYFCGGGEWYRQVGEGPSARYKAVARKL